MRAVRPPLPEADCHRCRIATVALGVALAACRPGAGQLASSRDSAATSTGPKIESAYHRPVFSPTGDRIVFMRQDGSTGGDWELFLANEDGSGVARLTTHPGWDGYAAWSPDGKRLSFDRDDGERTKKYSMLLDLESGATRRLGDFEGWLTVNAWSRDGKVLYGFWERDGQRDLYAISPLGEILERLTDTPGVSEHDAQLSPDGATLVFATERADGSGSGIASLDLASRTRRTLLTSVGRVYGLTFSPDGGTIAYTDNPGGGDDDAEIFLLDLASGARRQLTDNGDYDHMPVFHPSGSYLLFTSYRSGAERVYRLSLPDGAVSPFEFGG